MKETPSSKAKRTLAANQVYAVASACLFVGLLVGYALRAWHAPAAAYPHPAPAPAAETSSGHAPTVAEMKQIADKQASPLINKLKADPDNSGLLVQIGTIYHSAHQFTTAASWYAKAAQVDPSNVAVRNKLAASLYRSGDIDGSIDQLTQALHHAPTDSNSLFNLGFILWEGKHDGQGAVRAWQRLLKFNPGLSPDRRDTVEHLIAEVKARGNAPVQAKRSSYP